MTEKEILRMAHKELINYSEDLVEEWGDIEGSKRVSSIVDKIMKVLDDVELKQPNDESIEEGYRRWLYTKDSSFTSMDVFKAACEWMRGK